MNGSKYRQRLINEIISDAKKLSKSDRRALRSRLSRNLRSEKKKQSKRPPPLPPRGGREKRLESRGKDLTLRSRSTGLAVRSRKKLDKKLPVVVRQRVKGTSYHHIVHSVKTKEQYNKLRGPSISNAKTMRHQPTVMHEFFDNKGNRNCSVTAHLLLFDVTTATTMSPGNRIPGGMMMISPETIGSQLTLLSKQYQAYRLDELEIFYETEVPTTTEGAISLFFSNDTTTNQWLEGMDMKRHAASAPYYLQTPVWQNCGMKISPTELAKRYWTQSAQKDVSFQVLGLLTTLAASDLEGDKTYGSVYARIAITFEMPILSTEVELAPTFDFTWTWVAAPLEVNAPVIDNSLITTVNVNISPTAPNATGVYYGVVESNTLAVSFRTPEDGRPVTLTLGQGVFMRQWLMNSSLIFGLYADYESAINADLFWDPADGGDFPIINDGTVLYNATEASASGVLTVSVARFVSLDDTPDVL